MRKFMTVAAVLAIAACGGEKKPEGSMEKAGEAAGAAMDTAAMKAGAALDTAKAAVGAAVDTAKAKIDSAVKQ